MRAVISILVLALLPSLLLAQEARADELLKRAINAQQHGDYSEAITQYHKVLQLRPSDVEAEVNLGAALAHEGRYDEAIEMYRSALSSLKNNNMVRLSLALAYYKKGDFEHAASNSPPCTMLGPTTSERSFSSATPTFTWKSRIPL